MGGDHIPVFTPVRPQQTHPFGPDPCSCVACGLQCIAVAHVQNLSGVERLDEVTYPLRGHVLRCPVHNGGHLIGGPCPQVGLPRDTPDRFEQLVPVCSRNDQGAQVGGSRRLQVGG